MCGGQCAVRREERSEPDRPAYLGSTASVHQVVPTCKMEMIRPAAEDWSEDKFTWTNSVTAKHVVNAYW